MRNRNSLKGGFLVKRIKKVSRRKKWLAGITFWIIFFQIIAQVAILMLHRLPHLDLNQIHRRDEDEVFIISIDNQAIQHMVTYEIAPGHEAGIFFMSVPNNRFLPILMPLDGSLHSGDFFGRFIPIVAELPTANEEEQALAETITPQPTVAGTITPQPTVNETATPSPADGNIDAALEELTRNMEAQGATAEEIEGLNMREILEGLAMPDIAELDAETLAALQSFQFSYEDIAEALEAQGLEEEITALLAAGYIFEGVPLASVDWPYFIVLILASLWLLRVWWVSRRNLKKTYTHPVFRAFVREGGELENMAQFEEEIGMRNTPNYGPLIPTENWLFYNGRLKLKLRHCSEVVCVIQIRTQDWGFLTRWATRRKDIVIGFADKKQWRVSFGRHQYNIHQFKETMKEKLPHIVCDEKDAENFKLWQERPDTILEKVGEYKFQERMARKHEEAAKAELVGHKGRRRMRVSTDVVPPKRGQEPPAGHPNEKPPPDDMPRLRMNFDDDWQ